MLMAMGPLIRFESNDFLMDLSFFFYFIQIRLTLMIIGIVSMLDFPRYLYGCPAL